MTMARKTIKNRVIVKDGGFGAFVRNTRSLQGRVLVGLEDKPRKDGVSMAEVALATINPPKAVVPIEEPPCKP